MPKITDHPGKFISSELTDRIKNYSAYAEMLGELHPKQLETIYEERWWHLFVPKEYGGLELSLIEALQIEESLAWIDGSLGWTVTLCAGANWFIGFLSPEIARQVFSNSKVCFAGSGRPSGIAKVMESGYEVTGCWKYATGAPYATVFTANCFVEENGMLLKDKNGEPIVRSFWFKKEEVIIHKDWNSTGMIATASHGFEVKALRVHEERTFIIDSRYRSLHHPVYQFPFLQFAETTLAVNSSGMAFCFLDLCKKIVEERTGDESKKSAIKKLEGAKEQLNRTRRSFYLIVERSWDALIAQDAIDNDLLNEVSEASKTLANIARQAVDELYPYCGMIAAHPQTEINRVWRNIHTASQHSVLL